MAEVAEKAEEDGEKAQASLRAAMKEVSSAQLFGGAKKWGTFTERVKWVINTLFEAVGATFVGIAEGILWLGLKSYEIVQFLLVGLILLALRAFIIWIITELSGAAADVASIIDALLDFMRKGVNTIFDGVNLFMSFVNHDVIKALNKIPFVHIKQIHWSGLRWKGIPGVDATAVKLWCTSLGPTCNKFDSAPKILWYLIRFTSHSQVCPLVRYLYPLEKTYNNYMLTSVLGWMYYGSAEPTVYSSDKNCQGHAPPSNTGVDGNVQDSLNYTCIMLGVCYLYLDFYIGLVLVRAVLVPLWTAISKCFQIVSYFVEIAVTDALEITATTVKMFLMV
jgi:hypothetical protein